MQPVAISFIVTVFASILPLIYIVSYSQTITENLYAECLNNQFSGSKNKLCISCFNTLKTTENNNIGTNYLNFQRLSVNSNLPKIGSESFGESRQNLLGKVANYYASFMIKVPFRMFQYYSSRLNGQVRCQQFLHVFNYEKFDYSKNLNYLKLQSEINSIDSLRKILSIDFFGSEVTNGKYQLQLNRAAQQQIGFVFKQPNQAQNLRTITVKYFDYQTFIAIEMFQVGIGTGCLIFLILHTLYRLEKGASVTHLIVNLTVLLGIFVPQLLKILNVNNFKTENNLEFLFPHIVSDLSYSLFVCLCFKRVKINQYIIGFLLICLILKFNIWIDSLITIVVVIAYFWHTSMIIEYKEYCIYVGTFLSYISVAKIESTMINDDRGSMMANIMIMVVTVCMQIIDQINVLKFEEFGANTQKPKKPELMQSQQIEQKAFEVS